MRFAKAPGTDEVGWGSQVDVTNEAARGRRVFSSDGEDVLISFCMATLF